MFNKYVLMSVLAINIYALAMREELECLQKYNIKNVAEAKPAYSFEELCKKAVIARSAYFASFGNGNHMLSLDAIKSLVLNNQGLNNLNKDLPTYIAFIAFNLKAQGKLSAAALINDSDFEQYINVTSLNLTCNQLTELPEDLCNLTSLVSLDLSANKLTSLPIGLTKLTNLRILRLYSNPSLEISEELRRKLKEMPLDSDSLKDIDTVTVKTKVPQIDSSTLIPKALGQTGILSSLYQRKK